MVKMPYGGFDANPQYLQDDLLLKRSQDASAWARLHDMQAYLEECQPLPPELARWLGDAIRHSKDDPAEFLRLLGLKKGRGKPSQSGDAWLVWGKRICELEDCGLTLEKAIGKALDELGDSYSRSQLQVWRNQYRKAKIAHDAGCCE
jgi:hypothetical protein